VTFDVFEPDESRTAFVCVRQQTLSQDGFVRFLICGETE